MNLKFRPFFALILSAALLSGCVQLEQVKERIIYDWNKHFGPPVDPRAHHIYNFDTFTCDAARQLIVSFNPNGTTASIMFEEKQLLLSRTAPIQPYIQPPYAMYIMDDGTLLLEKHMDVLYKHCRPLVDDPTVTEVVTFEYDYTPTMTPDQARADELFREKMSK